MMKRLLIISVSGYAGLIVCLWQGVNMLADRAWPVTLIAFGPRWPAALPLLPLALLGLVSIRHRWSQILVAVLTASGVILVFGFMDYRVGLGRVPGTPLFRLMIHNLGEGHVTAEALDRLMKEERVDVAALQECPFYNNDMERLGWRFYYGGDLCLVSRFPFVALDSRDPDSVWRSGGREPQRFEIETPEGRVQLLNVHFATIREGLEALHEQHWRGLSQFISNREEAMRQARAGRERANRATKPIVIAGDFNLPVESAVYRDNWGDLRNAFSDCGRGFGYSKFTGWFGIRIDHVLMSSEWRCADARVIASPYGGDHVPVIVDLVLIN